MQLLEKSDNFHYTPTNAVQPSYDLSLSCRHYNEISSIDFNGGSIDIHHDRTDLPPTQLACAMLASMGFSNAAIAERTTMSANTAKSYLHTVFQKLQQDADPETSFTAMRHSIATRFFQLGVYTVRQTAHSLHLSGAELPVVEQLVQGKTNPEIGAAIWRSPGTIKTHLSRIALRNGLQGREQIVLGSLLSGEVLPDAQHQG